MEKLVNFLKTDNGKLVAAICGVVLFFVFVAVAAPKSINLIINSGSDCVLSFKSAKKTIKRKRRKEKKNKRNL